MPRLGWLIRGRRASWKRVAIAGAIAPALATLLFTGLSLFTHDRARLNDVTAMLLVVGSVSYAVTIAFGIPIFVLLSWFGFAGVLPTILAGVVPGFLLRGGGGGEGQLFTVFGGVIAAVSWAIAADKPRPS